jgi:hypothetical protein
VCTENGGPPCPPAPDLLYFPNRLQVVQGVENLRCFTLLEGYPTRRVVATCCWTALLGDHPSYDSVRLVTYPNPAIFTPHQDRPVDKRIFQEDMSLAELGALGPAPDRCSLTGPERKVRADTEAREQIELLDQKHQEQKDEGAKTDTGVISVQTLIEDVIGKVEVADAAYAETSPRVPMWNRLNGCV